MPAHDPEPGRGRGDALGDDHRAWTRRAVASAVADLGHGPGQDCARISGRAPHRDDGRRISQALWSTPARCSIRPVGARRAVVQGRDSQVQKYK